MPDENKIKKLKEIGYKLVECCLNCSQDKAENAVFTVINT